MPKVKRCGARVDVGADEAEQQAEQAPSPSALSSEPLASTAAATRPSTISEKYSAAPN